jgi:hypothetical protein
MDKVAELLKDLAVKLGTTAEHLWPLLVLKTRVDWVAEMIAALFTALLSVTALRWILKRMDADKSYDYEVPGTIIITVSSVFLLLSLVSIIVLLSQMSEFLLPEPATVERLLKMASGK